MRSEIIKPVIDQILDDDKQALTGVSTSSARSGDRDDPAVVRYFRRRNTRAQLSRGMAFVNRLTKQRRPWRYAAKGVRWGQTGRPVFWYRPTAVKDFRVIHADLSVWIGAPPNATGDVPRIERRSRQAMKGWRSIYRVTVADKERLGDRRYGHDL